MEFIKLGSCIEYRVNNFILGVVFGPEVPEQQDLQANDDSEEYVPAPGLDLP